MKHQPLKRLHTHRLAWHGRKKPVKPFVFAALFGCIMVAYGISRLLAATPVVFTMTPANQTVTAGQTKSITVSINPNMNQVDGGSVVINYDPSRLTFSKFTPANNTQYPVSGQTHTNGLYSFQFKTPTRTRAKAALGTIEFRAQSTTSGNAQIKYNPTQTRAYFGSMFYPSYYNSEVSGAVLVVQGTQPPPVEKCTLNTAIPKTDVKCKPCPYKTGIIASDAACVKPPATDSPPTTDSPDVASDEVPSDIPGVVVDDESNEESSQQETPDETDAATSQGKHIPVMALVAIIGGGLLIGTSGVLYMIRKRSGATLPTNEDIHGSLFDKPSEAETITEDTVVEDAVDQAIEAPDDTPQNDVVSATPMNDTAETAVLPEPLQPTPDTDAEAIEQSMPEPPPVEQPAATPEYQQPDSPSDEPKDMFELAQENPETYGSTQLVNDPTQDNAAPEETPREKA